jgi:hypothetical protein
MPSPPFSYPIGTKTLPLGKISSPAFPLPPFSSPKPPNLGGTVFPIPHFGETFSPLKTPSIDLSASRLLGGFLTAYGLNASLLFLVPFPQIDSILAGLDCNFAIAVLNLVSVEL